MKTCDKCGVEKEETKFNFTGKGERWRRSTCRTCCVKELSKWKRASTPEKRKEQYKRKYRRLKAIVLSHYGSKCACCGENQEAFLCLDHIDGGGSAHRKSFKKEAFCMYDWVVKNKFPAMFQILCSNCNLARHTKGECPHKSGKGMTLEQMLFEVQEEHKKATNRNADKSKRVY